MRTSFKHHQLRTMKSYFAINHNPDAKDLKQLSQKTGLPKRVLQVIFCVNFFLIKLSQMIEDCLNWNSHFLKILTFWKSRNAMQISYYMSLLFSLVFAWLKAGRMYRTAKISLSISRSNFFFHCLFVLLATHLQIYFCSVYYLPIYFLIFLVYKICF